MRVTLDEARRLALAAQGLGVPRPAAGAGLGDVRRVLSHLAVLQLDFVNVVAPAHWLVLFSRLGPYKLSLLEELAYRRRESIEQWAREASLVPVDAWPLLAYRRANHRVRPYGFEKFLEQNPGYVAAVLEQVRARGPLTAEEVQEPEGMDRRIPGAWHTVPRAVLEALFGRGVLAIAARLRNHARAYDLAERVIPAQYYGREAPPGEARRQLLLQAARACGVGTAADLADYYRMPVTEAKPAIGKLVAEGRLRQVTVESWRQPAYLHPDARPPDGIQAATLLAPFDPLVWHRARLARLFAFDYRLEIFVPEARRKWGCYVLPFLFGERLAARVDLKADREGRRLLVHAAWLEPGHPPAVAGALAAELHLLARWLGLDSVAVGRRGNLSSRLRAKC